MTKTKTSYRCASCAVSVPQWAGKCSSCGDWNTLVEEIGQTRPTASRRSTAAAAAPLALSLVDRSVSVMRETGVAELDRVLAGGLASGSVTLIGGEPGIGKSTLVLQLCAGLAASGARCLVVTGEESPEQVSGRAQRLGVAVDDVLLLAETDLDSIVAALDDVRPDVLIVDSVQTMSVPGVTSSPGTVTQVRECAQAFVSLAKERNMTAVLVGHVTKEGTLAGPRVLEHVVDTVLEFEGDRHHGLRFLRAVKHRFGTTDEVGVLEMTQGGLVSVPDASGLFLDDRRPGVAGSVVVPTLQGRRPVLVELQALVSSTNAPMPRRVAPGFDSGRFAVVLAVLQQRAGVVVAGSDVYGSVVGGVKIDDPGCDLALAMAVVSATTDKPFPADAIAVGELGLGGEVRKVSHMTRRLTEAHRMGFRRAFVPEGSPDGPAGLELTRVPTLRSAVRAIDAV